MINAQERSSAVCHKQNLTQDFTGLERPGKVHGRRVILHMQCSSPLAVLHSSSSTKHCQTGQHAGQIDSMTRSGGLLALNITPEHCQ